jgi:hypothetical protein
MQGSGKVTRMLRLLPGHGIIAKIARPHRYQLTEKGRNSLSALLAARKARAFMSFLSVLSV